MRLAPSSLAVVLAAAASAALGCSPPVAPQSPATVTPERDAAQKMPVSAGETDVFALTPPFREEKLGPEPVTTVALPAARPRGVPVAPTTCAASPEPSTKPSCDTAEAAQKALADALDLTDAKQRDGRLAALESCALPPGFVRALRADLGPVECADLLAEPYLASAKINDVSVELKGALVGLVYAAWATRAVTAAPPLAPPHTKAKVLDHVKGPGLRWVQTQAGALDEITKAAIRLPLYGRAVAAVEIGSGYLRFVEGIRGLPVPDEFKQDKELADAYFGSLDQLFEAQKGAGRDAALVGLRDFAAIGAIDDARVARARRLLGTVYGGKKIDALDSLVLEPRSEPPAHGVPGRLARTLPTFFAGVLLPAPAPGTEADADVLAGFAKRGLPMSHRKALQEGAKASAEASASVASARFAMGQRYWRSVDFDQALRSLAQTKTPPAHTLLLGLALALRNGPDGAGEVVKKLAGSLGALDVRALEKIASENPSGPLGAAAAFDAARLLELAPPSPATATFYTELAARYRDAAKRDPSLGNEASKRADNADLLAKDLAAK